jgi:hypothetical protein
MLLGELTNFRHRQVHHQLVLRWERVVLDDLVVVFLGERVQTPLISMTYSLDLEVRLLVERFLDTWPSTFL